MATEFRISGTDVSLSDDDENDHRPLSIESLPAEVLELILRLVSPYEDLRNCRLVCREWHKLVQDVIRRRRTGFVRDVRTMNVQWSRQPFSLGPSIFARYGHASCRHADSMYVFGGCTGRNTTFNDLWRFDLNTRRWIRPLAVGTYPPPMAFSTFVLYKGILVLFGGLTYPSPSVLHQFDSYRLYNKLHFYETYANRWLELTTTTKPPHVAGHSASVHGHLMVVFGGRQYGRPHGKSNDVWVLNLKTIVWWKQATTDPKPPPMVNQTQVAVDENHLLIFSGFGEPNSASQLMAFAWLLKLESDPNIPWTWRKMSVGNRCHAVSNHWYHPACKVEDKLVFLGRDSRSMSPMSPSISHAIQSPLRIWIPPREENVPLPRVADDQRDNTAPEAARDEDKGETASPVNGHKEVLLTKECVNDALSCCSSNCQDPGTTAAADIRDDDINHELNANMAGLSDDDKNHSLKRRKLSSAKDSEVTAVNGHSCDPLAATTAVDGNSSLEVGASNDAIITVPLSSPQPQPQPQSRRNEVHPSIARNSVMPSIRPNSLKNRVRQMESFQRMEQRIRNMMRPPGVAQPSPPPPPPPPPPPLPMPQPSPPPRHNASNDSPFKQNLVTSARQPMLIYVLDIARAVDHGVVEWLPLQHQSSSDGPEDTAFYSLVKGRGEIIMFGGIQKDHSFQSRLPSGGKHTVTNNVYILSSKPPF